MGGLVGIKYGEGFNVLVIKIDLFVYVIYIYCK